MNQRSYEFKELMNDFCKKAYEIIKTDFPKIRSIIIQYNKDKIFIGSASSGIYKPAYYDPDSDENDNNLEELVIENNNTLVSCKDAINKAYPNNRMRSFNVFYNGLTREINICKNTIGNKSMKDSRLFDEFTD